LALQSQAASKEIPMKRIAGLALLAALSLARLIPAEAQGISIAEYERQSQEAAKKQQKVNRKAAKKQRKMLRKVGKNQRRAMKQYEKTQRNSVRKANHR
jgi:hypothetical protein